MPRLLSNKFPYPHGGLRSEAANLYQRGFIGHHYPLDRAKLQKQPLSQRGTDTGQTLKDIELLRREALRFSIISPCDGLSRAVGLIAQKLKDTE